MQSTNIKYSLEAYQQHSMGIILQPSNCTPNVILECLVVLWQIPLEILLEGPKICMQLWDIIMRLYRKRRCWRTKKIMRMTILKYAIITILFLFLLRCNNCSIIKQSPLGVAFSLRLKILLEKLIAFSICLIEFSLCILAFRLFWPVNHTYKWIGFSLCLTASSKSSSPTILIISFSSSM